MELSQNWLTEGLLDFEYKKYMVLAYLQGVEAQFQDSKLYPPFAQLYQHYKTLLTVRDSKEQLQASFPKQLTAGDGAPFELRPMILDDEVMQELENIIAFCLPEFESYLEQGKTIYQMVEEQLAISPVGLVPLNHDHGFFFLSTPPRKDLPVYRYTLTIYESHGERFRGVNVQYLETVHKSLANTYESLKTEVVKRHFRETSSSSYLVETPLNLPLAETLLPVTKRTLVRYLATKGLTT